MFNFSLKTKTEPMHTIIIPSPLNSGNRIIDGTLAASPVITKLITDSEIALPNAHKPIVFLCFRLILFMFFGFENKDNISAGTIKEYNVYAATPCFSK